MKNVLNGTKMFQFTKINLISALQKLSKNLKSETEISKSVKSRQT